MDRLDKLRRGIAGAPPWRRFARMFREGSSRAPRALSPADRSAGYGDGGSEVGFVESAPSAQNVLDVFDGEWSTVMPDGLGATARPGVSPLFSDPRIHWADAVLGPFRSRDILELGPLEGAHSFILEQLGAASITAIEGNPHAFLRCLCVKEIMDMKHVSFKLGNFVPYLQTCRKFDAIIACGVLYHMVDPLLVLRSIVAKTDRVMIWTHYYDEGLIRQREDGDLFSEAVALGDGRYRASKRLYPESALAWKGFSGGSEHYAVWVERQSLLDFFQDEGFATTVNFETPDHPNGPSFALCATR